MSTFVPSVTCTVFVDQITSEMTGALSQHDVTPPSKLRNFVVVLVSGCQLFLTQELMIF